MDAPVAIVTKYAIYNFAHLESVYVSDPEPINGKYRVVFSTATGDSRDCYMPVEQWEELQDILLSGPSHPYPEPSSN